MSIKFNAEEKADLISRLQDYCDAELDRELGSFEAQFMLDFISDTMGPFFYNRGIYDAQAMLQQQLEQVGESIYELEQVPKKPGWLGQFILTQVRISGRPHRFRPVPEWQGRYVNQHWASGTQYH